MISTETFCLCEVERLIGLGATEVHWDKRPPDADYVILADPEGKPVLRGRHRALATDLRDARVCGNVA